MVVFPKVSFDDYNPDQVRWLADIVFAESPAAADALYPRNAGQRDLFTLRELFASSRYAVVTLFSPIHMLFPKNVSEASIGSI